MHQVTVTFNFDPTEETPVSDLTCFIDGIEKKKKTTRSTKTKEIVLEDEALVTLEPTKIQLNNKAVADMNIVYGERVIIKYEKIEKTKKYFPVIGSDTSMGEEGSGNKITKTNSVAYKGKANTILAEYGTEFSVEPYKEGVWKLVSKNPPIKKVISYQEIENQAEDLDFTMITDSDEEIEIGEMPFKL